MKNLVLLVLMVVSLSAFGQNEDSKDIDRDMQSTSAEIASEIDYRVPDQRVHVGEKPMSLGVENAYTLFVDDIKEKDLMNTWKDYIKDVGGAKGKKVKGAKHEQFFEEANIYEIGYNDVDIYGTVFDSGDDAELVVWIMAEDQFVGPDLDPAKSEKAEAFMRGFGVHIEKLKVEEEIEDEEDELNDLRKDYEKLQKNKRKLEDKIDGWRKDIEKAEREIIENLSEQEVKAEDIKTQEEKTRIVKAKLNKF